MSSPMLPAQQRVPAWKRLGLKLKPASENKIESQAHTTTTATHADVSNSVPKHLGSLPGAHGVVNATKRKPSGPPVSDHFAKKARNGNLNSPATRHTLAKKKSVTFAAEPAEFSSPVTTNGKHGKDKQKKSSTKKPVKPLEKKQATANLGLSVEYLRQWHSAREVWKFNKNHQSKLLENVFADGSTIPAVDINLFYLYIRGLKGYVRTRLRESAVELKTKDMEQGPEAFSNSSTEVAQKRQKEYEEIIAGYLKEGHTPEKRRFEEVEYVLRTTDMEMQRRVVKRMRAEMIIDELSESEETACMETTTSTATPSEKTTGNGSSERTTTGDADDEQTAKSNNGTRKRKRKARTTEVDDESSSSESEVESESETSSSDSSSESDDDEEMNVNSGPTRTQDTSSSSSSSSSESDSDSDDEESDEANE